MIASLSNHLRQLTDLLSWHPHVLAVFVSYVLGTLAAIIFAGLIVTLLKKWMHVGEFVTLVVDVLIVAMIGLELVETTPDTLGKVRQAEDKTVDDLDKVRQAQEKSLATLEETLTTIKDTDRQITSQFHLEQRQYAERALHPVIRVTAITVSTQRSTPKVLEPSYPGFAAETAFFYQAQTGYRLVRFVLRNVGTADAIHLKMEPEAAPGMRIVCVEYPQLRSYAAPLQATPCEVPSGINLTLPFRPANLPPVVAGDGAFTPDFDGRYDVLAEVWSVVQKGITDV